MKIRKSIFWLVAAVCLTAVCAIVAAAMIWYMPEHIARDESRMLAIQQAMAECSADQRTLSKRVAEITDQVVKEGRNKTVAVYRMLSDADLNRLALNYMETDFATSRSSFVGEVKHSRELFKKQKASEDGEKKEREAVSRKLQRLESKKKFLSNEPAASRDHRELADVESQIRDLRKVELDKFNKISQKRMMKSGNGLNATAAVEAQLEAHLFKIAEDYEKNSVVALERAIAARKRAFQQDEQRIAMVRSIYDRLNVWPFPTLRRLFVERK